MTSGHQSDKDGVRTFREKEEEVVENLFIETWWFSENET